MNRSIFVTVCAGVGTGFYVSVLYIQIYTICPLRCLKSCIVWTGQWLPRFRFIIKHTQ